MTYSYVLTQKTGHLISYFHLSGKKLNITLFFIYID